jgi:hypothetical protein
MYRGDVDDKPGPKDGGGVWMMLVIMYLPSRGSPLVQLNQYKAAILYCQSYNSCPVKIKTTTTSKLHLKTHFQLMIHIKPPQQRASIYSRVIIDLIISSPGHKPPKKAITKKSTISKSSKKIVPK